MTVRFRTADGKTATLPGPFRLSKDTYDAIRAGVPPLRLPDTLAGAAPPEFVDGTDITPARFNRVVAQELEELEGFEPVLRRQYERIIRRLGRQITERFRELATETPALAAAYDPNQPRDPGGEGGGQWVSVAGGDERLIPTSDEYTQLVRGARIRVHDDDFVHERMRGLEGTLESATKDALGVHFPNIPGVEGGMSVSVNRRDADMVAHPGSPGDERVQTAMRVWRGDFSSSLALKALIEGREPAPAYRGKDYVELAGALDKGLEQAGHLSQTAFRIVPGDPPQVGSQVKFTAAAAGIDRGMVEEYRTTFLTGYEKPTVFLLPPDTKALYYPDGQEAIVRGDFTVDEVNWSEERKVWEARLRSSHSLTSAGAFREEMVRRWPKGTDVAGPVGGGRFAPKEASPASRQSSEPDKPWERDIRHQLAEHFKKKGVFDAYGTADRIMPYGKEFMLAELKPRRTNVKYGHVTSFTADVVLLFPGSKVDVISGQEVPSAKGKMPAELVYKAPLSKAGKPLKTKTTITRKTLTSAAVPPTWNPPTVAELLAMLLDDATTILAGPTATQRKVFQTVVDGILYRLGMSFEVRSIVAQSILNGLAARSEAILEGIRTPVARIIANSYLNGLSVPQTAAAIQEGVDGLADWQATQLARNDLVGMANGGSFLAAKIVNEKFPGAAGTYKEWLATDDERTRPTHNEAHGQRVPLETAFVVGGAHLDYPGDPRGPDGEVINCRCTLIYYSEPKAVTAAFREDQHPRDPGGDAGGEFIAKGATGVDEGEGEEEEKPAAAKLGKPIKLKEPEGSTKKPTEKTVIKNAQAVMDDVADFYGGDRKSPAMYEPEACAQWGVDARAVILPSQMEEPNPEQEVFFGLPIMDKAREPDYGVYPYRQIAHEAIHANVSGQRFTHGFYHDYEEASCEILSINYWAERGQPFDHRDAVRVDGRWTAPGAESLAHSVVYRDQVADLMRRSASSVGWDRPKIVAEVLRIVKGDSNTKLKFRDGTDPEFKPPAGVSDDAVGLIHWLITKDAVTAAFDETKHPRDPGGEGGGQFIEKGSTAEGAPPASAIFRAGTTLYHASYGGDAIVKEGFHASRMGESGPGVYLTPTTNMFERYPERQHLEVTLGKDITVLDRTQPDGEDIYRKLQIDASIDKKDLDDWGPEIGRKLNQAGYEGVYYDSGGDIELVVHDPSILKAHLVGSATFVETQHPRHPKGTKVGGRFAPKMAGDEKLTPAQIEALQGYREGLSKAADWHAYDQTHVSGHFLNMMLRGNWSEQDAANYLWEKQWNHHPSISHTAPVYLQEMPIALERAAIADERIGLLDQAIGRSSVAKDTVVYRGMTNPGAIWGMPGTADFRENLSTIEGRTFTDKGFTAATYDQDVARNGFAKAWYEDGWVMRFTVPKGTPALLIDEQKYGLKSGLPNFASESEILLGRGHSYKVKKLDEKTRTIDLEMTG